MIQTPWESFVEALTNTFWGFVTAFAVNIVAMWSAGVAFTLWQNVWIVTVHTVVSVVRNYIVRRRFNRRLALKQGEANG